MEHRDGHASLQIQGLLCFPCACGRREGQKRSRSERKKRKKMTTDTKRDSDTESPQPHHIPPLPWPLFGVRWGQRSRANWSDGCECCLLSVHGPGSCGSWEVCSTAAPGLQTQKTTPTTYLPCSLMNLQDQKVAESKNLFEFILTIFLLPLTLL